MNCGFILKIQNIIILHDKRIILVSEIGFCIDVESSLLIKSGIHWIKINI